MKTKQICWSLAIIAGIVSCKNEKTASPDEVLNSDSKNSAQTKAVLRTVTESTSEATRIDLGADGGPTCKSVANSTEHVRAGSRAFKHTVQRCGERAELEIRPGASNGGTYAYGWSVYIPSNWENNVSDGESDIITQMMPLDTHLDFKAAGCGGAGSKIAIKTGNSVVFDFAHKGASQTIQCEPIPIYSNVSSMKGRWTDFVMRVKWSGTTSGFIKFYVKEANGTWKTILDRTNTRTYWEGENSVAFKMGLYKGQGDWNFGSNNPRILWTDEFRMGDANASFQDVSPGDSGSKTW